MSVAYFGRFPGPFFLVYGPEGGAFPISEAVFFYRIVFLLYKGGDVDRKPPFSSCDACPFGDSFQIYFLFLFFNLYDEGGEAEL